MTVCGNGVPQFLRVCLDNKMIAAIAKEYKISNADITFREDCNVDQLIDVIEGNVRTAKNSRSPACAPLPWPN